MAAERFIDEDLGKSKLRLESLSADEGNSFANNFRGTTNVLQESTTGASFQVNVNGKKRKSPKVYVFFQKTKKRILLVFCVFYH